MVGIVTLKDGSVLTVGHDAEVRQWRTQRDQIERVGDAVFRHAVPIVSIAVSPDESLVAFADIESRVCVFERLFGNWFVIEFFQNSIFCESRSLQSRPLELDDDLESAARLSRRVTQEEAASERLPYVPVPNSHRFAPAD